MRHMFIVLVSVFLLFGCGEKINTQDEVEDVSIAQIDGTAEMVRLLTEVHSKIDPLKIGYHNNKARAQYFKEQFVNASNTSDYLNGRVAYALELLQAGETEAAINDLEKLWAQIKDDTKMVEAKLVVQRTLALSYIRLGEQENCINHHNEESCIIPISGKGVYTNKKGPTKAIEIYKRILASSPSDKESKWMLNIAYMTIGAYPNGVPKKHRIPAKEFKSLYNLPSFSNIAHKTVVSTRGLAGGSCVEDFNNDGFLDIVASSWGADDQIRVFFNSGDGNFIDHTKESGLAGITGGLNMIHADYNNDGFEDILVLRGAWYFEQGKIPNSLLRNNGDGTFSDVTMESGLLSLNPTQTATWADFNLDGWIDLFIGNESTERNPAVCELFINEKGKFVNRSEEVGLKYMKAMVKGVCSGDLNNDGYPEIYLSTLNSNNILLKNNGVQDNPAGISFSDVSRKAQVGNPYQSFPTWIWDYDNDGWLDLFAAPFCTGNLEAAVSLLAGMEGESIDIALPRVYRNTGSLTFKEGSSDIGLDEAVFAMGSNYGDIDNDGYSDFYLGTGEPSLNSLVPNKMYRNNKGSTFQDVTYSGRFGHIQKGHGVSFGDLDNDGDQDIFHVLGGAFQGDLFGDALFENPGGHENSWITLRLKGTTSNRSAIGARIKLQCEDENGNTMYFHHVVSTGGSFGSNSLQQEIGLGKTKTINSLEVIWPNKDQTVEVFTNVPKNKILSIKEGENIFTVTDTNEFSF